MIIYKEGFYEGEKEREEIARRKTRRRTMANLAMITISAVSGDLLVTTFSRSPRSTAVFYTVGGKRNSTSPEICNLEMEKSGTLS